MPCFHIAYRQCLREALLIVLNLWLQNIKLPSLIILLNLQVHIESLMVDVRPRRVLRCRVVNIDIDVSQNDFVEVSVPVLQFSRISLTHIVRKVPHCNISILEGFSPDYVLCYILILFFIDLAVNRPILR